MRNWNIVTVMNISTIVISLATIGLNMHYKAKNDRRWENLEDSNSGTGVWNYDYKYVVQATWVWKNTTQNFEAKDSLPKK